ncbi:12064_t:CDS:1, partial [Dentiscutata heterogama]
NRNTGTVGADCSTDSDCISRICQGELFICENQDFRGIRVSCLSDSACRSLICRNKDTCQNSDNCSLGSSCIIDSACDLGISNTNG